MKKEPEWMENLVSFMRVVNGLMMAMIVMAMMLLIAVNV